MRRVRAAGEAVSTPAELDLNEKRRTRSAEKESRMSDRSDFRDTMDIERRREGHAVQVLGSQQEFTLGMYRVLYSWLTFLL